MGTDSKPQQRHVINLQPNSDNNGFYMQKFRLYETRSNFYMIGWDKTKTFWKVLKIDRLESSELIIHEDPTTYSESECIDLLNRIHEGNKSTGGLKFVSRCYGIIGFIKFLGPYYILVITERRKIGKICGHPIYAITKSEMFPVPNSTVLSDLAYSKDENRYKKLLRSMDLTKDYFFSYSYHIMLSFQKNLSNSKTGLALYETMFVWNEFLTREIHSQLQNTLWTVALVYGFFKQATLTISAQDFILTLIARRSRHYAGTRYLKRGVNAKGCVANDVETEQIVSEDEPEGSPFGVSAVVQNRGSIPLFWSQETSRLNMKPDIILSRKDFKFEATKLHFEDLVQRYGNPIIILNLIKTHEKRPRETILRAEFADAIEFINKDLPVDDRLRFLHWDINKHPRMKATKALTRLGEVATNALELTGFLQCQLIPTSRTDELLKLSSISCGNREGRARKDLYEMDVEMNNVCDDLCGAYYVKLLSVQKGVLRTNCVDCLDRTNVGQYAYGRVALAHQLHALGFVDVDNINIDSHSPIAHDLMQIYEEMGDTLAIQYGGSAAHNKIFSEIRGQWKATTRSQELFRTLQRFYSNAYMDPEKQDAINVFLGHFQPEEGGPALWELNPDQHYDVTRHGSSPAAERSRSFIKRSLSEGNISCGSSSHGKETDIDQTEDTYQPFTDSGKGCKGISESTPEISACDSDIPFTRYNPSLSSKQFFNDMQLEQALGSDCFKFQEGALFDSSNFLDVDWLSSSGNSGAEETYDRSSIMASPSRDLSSDSVTNELKAETDLSASDSVPGLKKEQTSRNIVVDAKEKKKTHRQYSEKFVRWVNEGDVLFP
ncbi:Phosphoinositide phosphatase SAC2 [Capsicum annuum]|uniref:Phosphoinositide phosphatase SAC2 n=1 Tax=Capsicum annuum TaxID=4072 RepID=A0A1U8F7C5_CAPAN|nr:phosphoinositide phosphatase SAC2 isoform X1 [Capsicum annuum]KAF3651536.1 Phosphoinositide phosphatase SAC2 [Capsicum annuum]PHT62419.1 Phosphoinositide phosphatase SAC2 [Capsicum annuum]